MTRHLETLERAGLIKTSERGAEGGYVFNPRQVESLAGQLAGLRETVDLSESQLGEADRKILAHFLEADGSLRQIPLQPK
ncbi:MAG TPA: hypothetical protein VJ436_14790 [Anaerolineales bacterium]|nr:hypothetical protein [Anaerolineales bacterium]